MTEIHMADMTTIKEKIRETIYPNGTGAITAEKHQALLIDLVNDINKQKADAQALTELEEKVDSLPVGGDVKADGVYPDLIAGDLVGRGESVPALFGFRASGGKSIKDGRAYIKRIKGNSVVWNQLWDVSKASVQDGTISEENGIISILPTGVFPGLKHRLPYNLATKKVFVIVQSSANSVNVNVGGQDSALNKIGTTFYAILTGNSDSYATIYSFNATESFTLSDIQICDLTKAFPNDWQNINTIEDFNARVATLGVDLNAYNEGQVIHCNTESIKSVGDNAWDEEWERGDINLTTGVKMESNDYLRTKNYIDILPNCEYAVKGVSVGRLLYYDADLQFIGKSDSFLATTIKTFLTPANARYMMYRWEGATYNNDIMVTLVHSGWKQDTNAGYQPYWQDTLPLPIINKYFPDGMKSAGSAHDEIRYNKASGKWEKVQRIGEVDLGTLDWNTGNDSIFIAILNDMNPTLNTTTGIMAKYSPCTSANGFSMISGDDKTYVTNGSWVGGAGRFTIKDTAYTDAASFKAAMQGVILYYELAEPIVTEITDSFRDYYNVADFGTEQSQSNVPSAAFSADIIYQFNAVDMIREHELEITELQKVIATMQAQLASLTKN